MAKTIEIGALGEKEAVKFLRAKGYKITDRNKRQSHKEIDIIAHNKEYLAFVEVKTRSVGKDMYNPYGSAASAVNYQKQKNLIAGARAYLAEHPTDLMIRMDVIEVYLEKETQKLLKINHIENAYMAH